MQEIEKKNRKFEADSLKQKCCCAFEALFQDVLVAQSCLSTSAAKSKEQSAFQNSNSAGNVTNSSIILCSEILRSIVADEFGVSNETFNSGPFASGLWYLRGNKAVRVILSETNLPEIFMFGEITPLLDGSAYVTTFGTNSILWYLHEDRAEKVSEVKSLGELGQLPKISDKAFVTLYLAEREKRKNAEADAENQKDYFPESPGDGD